MSMRIAMKSKIILQFLGVFNETVTPLQQAHGYDKSSVSKVIVLAPTSSQLQMCLVLYLWGCA